MAKPENSIKEQSKADNIRITLLFIFLPLFLYFVHTRKLYHKIGRKVNKIEQPQIIFGNLRQFADIFFIYYAINLR
jgi:hypothetical protein